MIEIEAAVRLQFHREQRRTFSRLSLTFDARDRNTLLPRINLGLLSPLLIHNGFFRVFAVASRNTQAHYP